MASHNPNSSVRRTEAVRADVDQDILFQIIRSFRDFVRAVAELVSNGLDWRMPGSAPEIRILFFLDGKEPCLEVTDQSRGADDRGRQSLTSLGRSLARELGGMRGQKGSGSKAWIWHCREVVIETVHEAGTLYRTTVTVEKLVGWLFGRGVKDGDAWEVMAKPPGHPIRVTGTRIVMRGLGKANGQKYKGQPMVNPKETRSPERLVAELAECLPPNAGRFVTVVDWDGNTHALAGRKIEGDPIIGEIPDVPGVGDMSWDVAVVANRQAGLDQLRIGALGTYVTWQEFVRLLRRNARYRGLLAQLDVFGDPHLSGYIEATGLNDHRAASSETFDPDVAENEALVEGILIALIERMLPDVRQTLKADHVATSDDRSFLVGLASLIQEATGVVPKGGPTRRVKVAKRRTSITLEPGDRYEIEVEIGETVRLVWDDSGAGGTMSPKRGNKGTYTAGDTCGSYVLLGRNMADAAEVFYEVHITIVAAIPFAFGRAVWRMDTDDRARVYVDERVLPHTSGDIVFRIAETQGDGAPTDVCVEKGSRPHEAWVASGSQEGFLVIEVLDAMNPSAFHATARVSVEAGFRDRSKERSPLDIEFEVEGRRYALAPSSYAGTPEAMRHVSYLTPGTAVSTITLNLDHPVFAGKADAVRREMALLQIALRVVEHGSPDIAIDTAVQEAGVVYCKITQQGPAKS